MNEVHARLVIHLLQRVVETAGGISAAVITPYWGQARQIRRRLPHELRSSVTVDTVHRFQGGERPLVIVDLPDSPEARLGRFMRGRGVFDDGSRLLTVALSRPQAHLVVVGNLHFLRRSAPRNGSVARLLDYLLSHAVVLDPVTLVSWGGGVHWVHAETG